MKLEKASDLFASLGQHTRLQVLRLLVAAGPEGLPAGALSDQLNMAHNSMSFHLGQLKAAGLVRAKKQGRSIFYRPDYDSITALARFLLEDCCANAASSSERHCITGYSPQAESPDDKPRLKFSWSNQS